MSWINIFILFISILIYLHIFIHFKVNIFNEFSILDDINKVNIADTIDHKLPFVFDGSNIIQPYDLSQCSRINSNKNIYLKTYDPTILLEPFVPFFTKDTLYKLKKGKNIKLHKNTECRNFYMVHSGKVLVYCIHPSYKQHILNDKFEEFIENNSKILRIELYSNQILFLPNYWFIYIKAIDKSVIEKLQYSTLLNQINIYNDKLYAFK